jgi:hypothetical protein
MQPCPPAYSARKRLPSRRRERMLASRVVHGSTRNMRDKTSLIQPEQIEQVILLIRGQRVMLDRDLAALYGVETKNVT